MSLHALDGLTHVGLKRFGQTGQKLGFVKDRSAKSGNGTQPVQKVDHGAGMSYGKL